MKDYVGAFAVTSGIGAEVIAREFEVAGDDYSAILVKALADRLAEAFAAYLHAQARADWGIATLLSPEEALKHWYDTFTPTRKHRPIKLVLPVGFVLVALQGISELIKRLAFLNDIPVESLEAHYERPTQ